MDGGEGGKFCETVDCVLHYVETVDHRLTYHVDPIGRRWHPEMGHVSLSTQFEFTKRILTSSEIFDRCRPQFSSQSECKTNTWNGSRIEIFMPLQLILSI